MTEDVGGASLLPLQTHALSYHDGTQRLIDNMDLCIDGEGITMVLGANGAGKSLLLRLLNGLLQPSSGSISYAGRSLNEQHRKRLSMVFQRPVLLRRSVAANMAFAARDKERHDSDALLALVGLQHKSRQAARLLSGGEAQRLALARALLNRPAILFLDEPTASLDPAAVLAIEDIVRQVAATGTRIVFVTHDTAQARRLADDIVFLHHGQIAEQQPATDFFASPTSEAATAWLQGRIVL